jgi:hypothetical protein
MAVPSSGQLREYADIGVELGVAQTNVSLRGMSQTAGFSTPDAMSEFYGYSGECTTGVADVFGDGSGIALYQLNNNASDASGNYNGVAFNVNYQQGQIAAAANFFGGNTNSNTGIQLPQALAEGNAFSYSFWFNTQYTGNDTQYMISKRTGNNTFNIKVYSDGKVALNNWFGSFGSTYNVFSTNPLNDQQWHHLVFTYDESRSPKTICYIDGSRDTSMDWDFDFVTQSISNGNALGRFDAAGRNYIGSLDQVRIFTKAISASEVTSLYSEQICSNVVGGDNFNTVLYTGNGGTQSITGVGFQPDLVWIKGRVSGASGLTWHLLYDSIRGIDKALASNVTNSELSIPSSLTSFNSDGFSLGSDNGVGNTGWNQSGVSYVAWCWKAGGAAVTNTNGTITSQVSANPEAGFSVVTWTTTSAAAWNVGHGLGTAPSVIISKMRTPAANWWEVYHTSLGTGKYLALQTSGATYIDAGAFSSVTDTTWTSYTTNTVGSYVAYCFTEVSGYSSFGSYTGNGSTNGPTVITGFEPAFVMFKNASAIYEWVILDNKRSPSNPRNKELYPNYSNNENSVGDVTSVNFLSNGFQIISPEGATNQNNGTIIYMAFAN